MIHGGRLDQAAILFPAAPQPWIDLSTGINPFAWDGAVPPIDQRRLPSAAALRTLETTAAAAFGAAHLPIAALPGSELGLRLLGQAGLSAPHHVIGPGYRTHAEALARATVISPGRIGDAVEGGGTVLLANPNNPDGRLMPPEELVAIGRRLALRGGCLIVDEAFADARSDASVLPHLTADDRILVLRSFGKFYGLAGVRLGFACGSADLVERLRARIGSWPVSATALTIGTAAYADHDWQAATRGRLPAAAAELDAVLRRHGLQPTGGSPLFRLVEADDAQRLFARLAEAGILTRAFDYAPRWLRLGLPGSAAALARLDRALGDR